MKGPRKRSVVIAGHATSLSLEDEFWDELKEMARARRLSLAALLAEIDAARGESSLSSAARLFVLAEVKRGRGKEQGGA